MIFYDQCRKYDGNHRKQLDQNIDGRSGRVFKRIAYGIAYNGGFVLVTMSSGQTLKGEVGTEVMLRVGTAVCTASSTPGLIDTTSAGTLNNGAALEKNHLYMMTIEDRGVKATASTVKVLVRGSYTVA